MSIDINWRIIVEPNELIRLGLVNLIGNSESFNCAAFDSVELMEMELDPSVSDAVLLVNFGPDEQAMIEGLNDLKKNHPKFQVVLLCNAYSHSYLHGAIRAGARGYLLTSMDCKTLVKSLDVISLGQPVIPEEALELISNGHSVASIEALDHRPSDLLSERELIVLRCLSRAMSNKLIARECNICEATVKVHVKAILRKINGKNRTEAAIWALEHGLAPIEYAQKS